VTPIPTAIAITAPTTSLNSAGATVQLTVTATYTTGDPQNMTAGSNGTLYNLSNPAIATVSSDGLVTAVSSGTVVVQAVNEGRQGIISLQVVLSGTSHGGIPDDWAISHGLDPNDPAMPFEDPDHDGLTNLQEFQNGTDPHNPDTDGDGLTDGQEVLVYHTNPALFSTDGTGISDGIEVQTGTLGGTLAAKLSAALSSLEIRPSTFILDVNSIQGVASQQLDVLGHLIDGKTTIDLTSTVDGTTYKSSDLTICNFGTPDGNIFAGSNGSCVITVGNNGFTAQATAAVRSFTPTALSFVAIPGFANGVDVNGNYAFVAAGSAGLQVVNVSNRTSPSIAASLSLPGNANDVRLLGNFAYVAAGSAGLHVIDISNPLSPVLRGTLSTGGNALDVAVRGTTAYIANGSNLFIADVTNPAAMTRVGTLSLNGNIQGIDVSVPRNLAVVAAGTNGIYVVDISNPVLPILLGTTSTGDARDVAIQGNYAFVADFVNSTTSVNITGPSAPVVLSHITDPNLGGFLQDIKLSANFALAADVKFVNGIPITDISDPTSLHARAILNFPQRDDNGMGIAADGTYVYLVTEHSNLTKFGSSGDSRLYIGQYLALVDNKGIPPTATITSPTSGSTVIQGSTLPITVNASDDVAVAAVNFLVNGTVVFTATSAPYQFNFTVPAGASRLTIDATAVDLGGNTGSAQTVTLNVIPDPLTTVTGQVVFDPGRGIVTPENPNGWSVFSVAQGSAQITGTNPRSGNGSLELIDPTSNSVAALIRGDSRDQGYGLWSNLNVFHFDWFIAADSKTVASPDIALRIYRFGDPRSFFLQIVPCTSSCPVGSWQSASATGHFTIQAADGNIPPASIAAIPPDAFVSEIHLRGAFPAGGASHGFVDNVRIGFVGEQAITFNFEASATITPPQPVSGANVSVGALSTTTKSDGTFAISNVPTVFGNIVADATATMNGSLVSGTSSSTLPSGGGITNVGTIQVSIDTPPIGFLDGTQNSLGGGTILSQNDTLMVAGWAADQEDGAPVGRVSVLIDGVVVGNATLGLQRNDVAIGFGRPDWENSGWTFSYSVRSLALGTHHVAAVAYDSAGLSANLPPSNNNAGTITVGGDVPPVGSLDLAVNAIGVTVCSPTGCSGNTTLSHSDTLVVDGWAADEEDGAPVRRVAVLIDGTPVGNATLGLPRPDVANGTGRPDWLNSGWTFSYPASSLAVGTHHVTVAAYDSAGLSTTLTPFFNAGTITVIP
jgi:hypothetical protein